MDQINCQPSLLFLSLIVSQHQQLCIELEPRQIQNAFLVISNFLNTKSLTFCLCTHCCLELKSQVEIAQHSSEQQAAALVEKERDAVRRVQAAREEEWTKIHALENDKYDSKQFQTDLVIPLNFNLCKLIYLALVNCHSGNEFHT